MQTVFCLIKNYGICAVQNLIRNLLLAMRRQAMHNQAIRLCQRYQAFIYLKILKILLSFLGLFFLAMGVLDRTHLRWFTRHSMIELVGLPGMRVEAVEAHVPGRLKTAINLLTFGLFERFLASQYRLRVRKTAQ